MLNLLWRVFFRLLYHECAFAYDWVSRAVSLGEWHRWQRAALPLLMPARAGAVLELAQGSGDLQADLQRAGFRAVALDISPQMTRLARRKLRRQALPAPLMQADARRLPLPSASFAAAVCTFPTAFIFEPEVLAELQRILLPSGYAVLVVHGTLKGGGPRRWLIRGLYRLMGQRHARLRQEEIAALFPCGRFEVAAQSVEFEASSAQLILLTKRPGNATPPRN